MTAEESWMAARAKEELEMLESSHPGRFGYLKSELKALIASGFDEPIPDLVATQGSSNSGDRKRRRSDRYKDRAEMAIERAEMVIERAEACLLRVREVKQSFFR